MKDIIIRELRLEDMPNICELLQTLEELDVEGVQRRKVLMEWCAFKNPFAGNEPTYFIAEDKGKIVAHLGRMPMMFVIKGELQKGYYLHELYVHPEYRKKGLGLFLSMSLFKIAEERSESFIFGIWSNEIALKLHKRRGYRFLNTSLYVKVLEPYPILKKYIRNKSLTKMISFFLKTILRVFEYISCSLAGINTGKDNFLKIKRLDPDYDDYYKKLIPNLGISPLKNSNYIKWKYLEKPYSKIEILAVKNSKRIRGIIVIAHLVKNRNLVATIVDIIGDPRDAKTNASLLRGAINYCKKKNVSYIRCYLSDKRYSKILKKLLFYKRSGSIPLSLANLEKSLVKSYILNIDNWLITRGDSDGFMF